MIIRMLHTYKNLFTCSSSATHNIKMKYRISIMRFLQLIGAVLLTTFSLFGQAQAAVISAHIGNNDPLTENFGLWPFNGGVTTTSLADDNGYASWQIANFGSPQQAVYNQLGGTGSWQSGGSGLTQQHIDDIQNNGFIMSLQARVIDGPIYDQQGNQQVGAVISVAGFSSVRFDIGLGSDGLGNTLVVVPDLVNEVGGSTFSYSPFGSPILVTGNDYHLYQLSYDPTSLTASLFIDGNLQATGYAGSAASGGAQSNNYGLAFASLNNATANFALAQLESGQLTIIPVPGAIILFISGLVALMGFKFKIA